jgi:hypothetical protein
VPGAALSARLSLLIALASFAVAIARAPADPDMFWHLASGKWMVEHREILRADVFSSTVSGQPYSVGEWLGEIVLYSAYALGGWAGLVALRGILVAVGAFFLTRLALRGARPQVALPLVAAALILSTIVWTDRPQLFTLALFPLVLDLLYSARDGATRRLVLIPPLLLVWTDLHGGYALGLAVVGVFALEAVLRRRAARAFVTTAVLGFAVTLLDPGSLGIGGAIAHAAAPPRFIVEESPPDVLRPAGFLFALFVLGTLTAGLSGGMSLLEVLLLVPLLWLALLAQRDMPYFAFAAVPYLATRLGPVMARVRLGVPRSPFGRASTPVGHALAPAAALALAVVIVMGLASLPTAADVSAYPAGATPLLGGGGTLLNEYDWGGYLIWTTPGRPVFVDGRLFPYLPAVFADWSTLVNLGPGWRDLLERYGVTTVLLRPDRALAGALREDGWRVAGSDTRWVLLSRP